MDAIDRIFQLKEERKLTNKEVELGAGLANSSLSQWKKGKGKPSLDNIVKVATFFDVSTDYLLCLSDIRKFDYNIEISLTEEEDILLMAYRSASIRDRFHIVQVCMNALDASSNSASTHSMG